MPESTPAPSLDMVYLVGSAGHPNYGDEFLTAAWLRHLARSNPDTEVWLDCPRPGLASHLFAGLHPKLRTTDTLFRVSWETMEMDRAAADAHVDRLVTDLGTPLYDLGLVDARRTSSLHILGGGYINATWPHHMALLRAALRLRELGDMRLSATGLGLTPAPEGDRLREYLSEFDHVSVRDEPSAELTGAEIRGDDAVLDLELLDGFAGGSAQHSAGGDVWVCIQNDMIGSDDFETAIQATRDLLTGPLAGRTVRYLEAMPGTDRIAFDRLSDVIPEENFLSFVRLWHGSCPARVGQVWLTTRYHCHLLAAACGAKGGALEVDETYYRVKHQSLIDAGTGWSVSPMGAKQHDEPAGDPGFGPIAGDLWRGKRAEAELLYPTPVRAGSVSRA